MEDTNCQKVEGEPAENSFFTSIASQIERGEELMVEETGRTLSGRFWMAI